MAARVTRAELDLYEVQFGPPASQVEVIDDDIISAEDILKDGCNVLIKINYNKHFNIRFDFLEGILSPCRPDLVKAAVSTDLKFLVNFLTFFIA